jgi:hypothetical protein
MMEIALRTSSSPTLEMSMPSMLMEPDNSSTIRNRATIIEDFPAPVLQVTETSVTAHECTKEGDIPPNNANFFTSLDGHAEALEDKRELRTILQDGVLDFQLPLTRPRSRRFCFRNFVRRLLFNFTGVIDDTLD